MLVTLHNVYCSHSNALGAFGTARVKKDFVLLCMECILLQWSLKYIQNKRYHLQFNDFSTWLEHFQSLAFLNMTLLKCDHNYAGASITSNCDVRHKILM